MTDIVYLALGAGSFLIFLAAARALARI